MNVDPRRSRQLRGSLTLKRGVEIVRQTITEFTDPTDLQRVPNAHPCSLTRGMIARYGPHRFQRLEVAANHDPLASNAGHNLGHKRSRMPREPLHDGDPCGRPDQLVCLIHSRRQRLDGVVGGGHPHIFPEDRSTWCSFRLSDTLNISEGEVPR